MECLLCLLSFRLESCRTFQLSFFSKLSLKLISQCLEKEGVGEAGVGVIWLEEVTMRYGGEEGRLFDTATRWCCAVMYNGNTSELAESRMACTNYTHVRARAHSKLQTHRTYRLSDYHMKYSASSGLR